MIDVRKLSARIPAGHRAESARCPLYPTRPDPTRPLKSAEFSTPLQSVPATLANACGDES